MNELTVFKNEEFGTVRTMEINEQPYFVGKDVADILGYQNASKALADHVDDEDKLNNESLSSLGQRGGWLINESGLYSLVLSSKLPNAKRFKHWVTSEVLPSIRKHGAYMTPETLEKALLNPDGMITVLKALKAEQEKRKALEVQNKQLQPKALFADAVTASETSILVRDFAKILRQNGVDIGEKRLYKWFRDNGFIIKNSTEPTQRAMEMGLFERIERTVQRGDKPPLVTSTTKLTGKGQVYFTNKFLAG
ncbi:BRO family protein [Oribacterium sp. HCP28S3_H8]|uniref:BRO family protein n=1 Tax=Oribacterium sp. HCP28S3_H8 TaxID=3438945 RepID=UPI003F88B11B